MFGNLHNRLCRFAVLTYRVFRDLRGIPNVKSVAELMRYCATLEREILVSRCDHEHYLL